MRALETHPKFTLALGLLLLILLAFSALSIGQFSLGTKEIFQFFYAKITGQVSGLPQNYELLIWQIRLPRIIAALMIGAALSASGATYQSVFKNPLVSPDILGVSTGAGLGATIAIFFDFPFILVMLSAFIGGLLATVLVVFIATNVKKTNPTLVLVLTGITVGALLGATISLFKIFADPYTQLITITFWLMGGLNTISMDDILPTLPLIIIGLIPIFLLSWRINLLSLSEEEALSLGLNLKWIRLILIICVTLICATCVAISGIIGWIGLIVPHMARLILGSSFKKVFIGSIFIGSAFLLITDTLCRTITPIELPLSILSAFIGAPVFLCLLMKQRESL